MTTLTRQLATFLDLIKFAHTIFALPFALVAFFLALHHTGRWADLPLQLTLVLACMVAARTFAMTVNRLLDRRFDALNPRTARRPSVTGAVSPAFMIAVSAVSALAFLAAAFSFYLLYHNPFPALLALPVLLWLGSYSLTKRFTSLCHFWLGISLGLAPVSVWIALVPPHGPLTTPPILLLAAVVVFWVAGFDILYALQDEDIDRAAGLHSIPAALGRLRALLLSRACHALTLAALAALGLTAHLGLLYWTGFTLAAALLILEQSLVRPTDISKINLAFMTLNGFLGLAFGTLAIADVLLR